jgi:small subunit ribosomal protein S3Ae
LKKEWWDIKAPGMFINRKFTKTPVNQSAGKKLSSDALKGRVFEINLGDLNGQGALTYKKIKLVVDDASEAKARIALTNFYGMDTTRDHLCSLIRKWHTLIEAVVDAKTSDGFLLRFFPIAFTQRGKHQLKATTYAQRSQVKQIRKKMVEVITREASKSTLKDLVLKLIHEKIPTEITQQAKKIFPIHNCIIRKVKTLKRPRFDITQLLSIHSDLTTVGAPETKEETTTASANLVK